MSSHAASRGSAKMPRNFPGGYKAWRNLMEQYSFSRIIRCWECQFWGCNAGSRLHRSARFSNLALPSRKLISDFSLFTTPFRERRRVRCWRERSSPRGITHLVNIVLKKFDASLARFVGKQGWDKDIKMKQLEVEPVGKKTPSELG